MSGKLLSQGEISAISYLLEADGFLGLIFSRDLLRHIAALTIQLEEAREALEKTDLELSAVCILGSTNPLRGKWAEGCIENAREVIRAALSKLSSSGGAA